MILQYFFEAGHSDSLPGCIKLAPTSCHYSGSQTIPPAPPQWAKWGKQGCPPALPRALHVMCKDKTLPLCSVLLELTLLTLVLLYNTWKISSTQADGCFYGQHSHHNDLWDEA